MEAPHYRAWRFVMPGLDTEEGPGLVITPTGGIGMVEDEDAVRQGIFLLLSTWPGERVMRPDYGCELYRLVFAPNDDTTAGLAIHYVRQALERWEPRIEILHLDAARNHADPERLDVSLEYRLRLTRRVERLNLAVNLTGE